MAVRQRASSPPEFAVFDFFADRPDPATTSLKRITIRFETTAGDGTSGDYVKVTESGVTFWEWRAQ